MELMTPEMMRELGKSCLFESQGDPDKKQYGIKLLLDACNKNDPEASFIIGRLVMDGVLALRTGDTLDYSLKMICRAANWGYLPARAYLNNFCERRYDENFDGRNRFDACGELVDFEGKRIRISRKGRLTPIDAVLEYRDGVNVLSLSANVHFIYCDTISNTSAFESAVMSGFKAWQGDYEVFGGQKVRVEVSFSTKKRVFDNLIVIPVTESLSNSISSLNESLNTERRKDRIRDIVSNKRSFATNGLRWSVGSRKIIWIQSDDGRFDEYAEISDISKHELGHALGLGDLYANESDSLVGVQKGTYAELDSYAIGEKFYNLVMCDHHGPIGNNDIEMVILAFRENRMQLYQPGLIRGRISAALGQGN